MKYFNNCKTLEEAKKHWRKLSMKLHPDKGGDKDKFIEMNAEYYSFCENFGKKTKQKKQFNIKDFESFIKENFGMDLEDSLELAYKVLTDITNLLNKKYPLFGFLAGAIADRAYSKSKQIIDKQTSNSRSSSQTEVEDDDINVG